MRYFMILALLFVFTSSNAETKQLICVDEIGESHLKFLATQERDSCARAANSNYPDWTKLDNKFDKKSCEFFGQKVKACMDAQFAVKRTYIFNTEDLESGQWIYLELYIKLCGFDPVTTPSHMRSGRSIITFSRDGEEFFNVDRKTLRAGLGTQRNYSCEVKAVETPAGKDNLI